MVSSRYAVGCIAVGSVACFVNNEAQVRKSAEEIRRHRSTKEHNIRRIHEKDFVLKNTGLERPVVVTHLIDSWGAMQHWSFESLR